MPDGPRLVPVDRLFELEAMVTAAGDGTVVLNASEIYRLLDHISVLGEALDIEAGDYCRVCGCTANFACEGGCDWAEEGLCTACDEVTKP